MRIVVTGGAGFIGANLCRYLSCLPEVSAIAVIDDLSTGLRSNLDGVDVEFCEGSILDLDAISGIISGADSVVHLAALGSVPRSVANPVATHEVNATGTLRVLEAVRQAGGPQTILASSSSVYGSNPHMPKHSDLAPRPMSPYAASKLAAEGYAMAWQAVYNVPTLTFRFFNVYGPLQRADHTYAAVIPKFIRQALREEPLDVHGDGEQRRDFTYVDTVCAVLADCIIRRVSLDVPVNLAYGEAISVLEVIGGLREILDQDIAIQFGAARVGDVRSSCADPQSVRSLTPSVRPIPFSQGLRRTVEWAVTQIL